MSDDLSGDMSGDVLGELAKSSYMYFYIIVLFPLTAILQLINITAS